MADEWVDVPAQESSDWVDITPQKQAIVPGQTYGSDTQFVSAKEPTYNKPSVLELMAQSLIKPTVPAQTAEQAETMKQERGTGELGQAMPSPHQSFWDTAIMAPTRKDVQAKATTALVMASELGIPIETAYNNMDAINEQITGRQFKASDLMIPGMVVGTMLAPELAGIFAPAIVNEVSSAKAAWNLAKALPVFMGLQEGINAGVSSYMGHEYIPLSGEGISALVPGASKATTTLLDLAELIGLGYVTAGITGGASRATASILESLTRKTITQYNLPKSIKVPASAIFDWQTGANKIDPELDIILKDVLTTAEARINAVRNGLDIEIPFEKIVTTTDRPWYAKLKAVLGKEPYINTTTEKAGIYKRGNAGLLEHQVEENLAMASTLKNKDLAVDVNIDMSAGKTGTAVSKAKVGSLAPEQFARAREAALRIQGNITDPAKLEAFNTANADLLADNAVETYLAPETPTAKEGVSTQAPQDNIAPTATTEGKELYHGGRDGIEYDQFNLDNVNKGVSSNAFAQGHRGVYLTDDISSARYFSRKANERKELMERVSTPEEILASNEKAWQSLFGKMATKGENVKTVILDKDIRIKDISHYPDNIEIDEIIASGQYDAVRFPEKGMDYAADIPQDLIEHIKPSKTTFVFNIDKAKIKPKQTLTAESKSEPKVTGHEYMDEETKAVLNEMLDLSRQKGANINSVSALNEFRYLDYESPEGQAAIDMTDWSKEDKADAKAGIIRVIAAGQHRTVTKADGSKWSDIELLSGHTADDAIHEVGHALQEQGKVRGWTGTQEEWAREFTRLHKAGDRAGIEKYLADSEETKQEAYHAKFEGNLYQIHPEYRDIARASPQYKDIINKVIELQDKLDQQPLLWKFNPGKPFIEPNDEYLRSIDPDLLCQRSEGTDRAVNYLKSALGEEYTHDLAYDIIARANGKNLLTPCSQCYVWSARATTTQQQKRFIVGIGGYDGSLIRESKNTILTLQKRGLRTYSSTDFKIEHAPGMMLAFADASLLGVPIGAYTKDMDFVRIFAPTGAYINISVGRNINVGADMGEAVALRKKYPNVGLIYVSFNDAETLSALRNKNTDHVIPWHKSMQSADKLAKRLGVEASEVKDYTNDQNETINGIKADRQIKDYEHGGDLETYLRLCKESGVRQKFFDLYNMLKSRETDLYMKLIGPEYGQFGGEYPYKPVQPIYDYKATDAAIAPRIQKVQGDMSKYISIAQGLETEVRNGTYIHGEPEIENSLDFANPADNNILHDVSPSLYSLRKEDKNPFKDSVVRTPVYHGTVERFDKFDPGRMNTRNPVSNPEEWKGFYFDTDPIAAKEFSRGGNAVMSVYLDIQKPAIGGVVFPMTPKEAVSQGYDGMIRTREDGHKEYVVFSPDQIHVIRNQSQYSLRLEPAQIDTPAFKKWFADSKVVDEEGKPLVVYHGTVRSFNVFDKTLANLESDMGGGFYFSNNPEDVTVNYASSEGPDLTNKIEREAERIANETDREYNDPDVIAEAKNKYVEHEGTSIPVYLSLKNPIIIEGGRGDTFLDYKSEYDEVNDEYGEPSGKLVEFIEALRNDTLEQNDKYVENLATALQERAMDYEGMGASELISIAKEELAYAEDDNGNLIANEIIRKAFEDTGYDGIIDKTVNRKFGTARKLGRAMDEVTPDTVHYIVFSPTQIKSATGNIGTFDENNPDIRYSLRKVEARTDEERPPLHLVPKATATEPPPFKTDNATPPPKGEYEPSKLSERTESLAIEKELIGESINMELSGYQKTEDFMKKQAESGLALWNSDRSLAMKVAMRQAPAPEGMMDATMYKVAEHMLIQEGNVPEIIRLASSPIATLLSQYGQQIKAADQFIDHNSPVKAIQKVVAARKDRAVVRGDTEEVKRLTKLISDLEKKLADKTVGKIIEKGKTTPAPKEKLTPAASIKAKLDEGKGLPDIVTDIQALALQFVREGITEVAPLVAAVHNVIKDFIPGITLRETADALSGYGKFKELDMEEAKVILRDLKGQMQQISKLADMYGKGEAPLKTGMERRVPSDEERRLIKLVENAKKELNLDITDPAKQLKSALDAVMTRLTNQIKDLTKQIETGQKFIKEKSAIRYDEATLALVKERDALKAKFDEIFGKEGMTAEQKLRNAVAAVERAIKENERRIAEGDLMPKQKSGVTSPQLEALRARNMELRTALAGMRQADPAYVIDQIKKRATKRIEELDRKLKAGDFAKKVPRELPPLDAEAKTIVDLRNELNKANVKLNKVTDAISPEEGETIVKLAIGASNAKTAMEEAPRRSLFDDPTDAEMDYGLKKVAFSNYVNDLVQTAEKRTILEDPWGSLSKAAGNAKAINASMDDSAIFNQGWVAMSTNPVLWATNAVKTFRYIYDTFGGKPVMDVINARIVSSPNYERAVKARLAVGTIEEAYPESWAAKVPAIGTLYKASENAFTGFVHKLRMDIFDKMVSLAEQAGQDINNKEFLLGLGDVVNSLTGRANLGPLEPVAGYVNNILFSPRFTWSAFDVLAMNLNRKNVRENSFLVKASIKNLLAIAGGFLGILVIANTLSPGSAEYDPRSSDFNKIKLGKARIKFGGPIGATITLISRLATMSYKNAKGVVVPLNSGKFGSMTVKDVLYQFYESRLSPFGRTLMTFYFEGEDFEGNKPEIIREARNLVTPLGAQNIEELIQKGFSPADIAILQTLDTFGLNTSVKR